MKQSIKLSTEQLQYISLFQKITYTQAKDCIEDEKLDRVIFIVEPGNLGKAIGKGAINIKSLNNKIQKNIDIVEYDKDPKKFIANAINQKLVTDVEITKDDDGLSRATVIVDANNKGLAVGRNGRNVERAKIIARRYFDIVNVMIDTPQKAMMEL
ncbi:MAG: transcription elongation factor NusA [Cenarchaeum symbiont of Oopsacas minuta]|nr:transcription elongation factor NusA [Cenarchaeum symbiont of Oopsacas minuta]